MVPYLTPSIRVSLLAIASVFLAELLVKLLLLAVQVNIAALNVGFEEVIAQHIEDIALGNDDIGIKPFFEHACAVRNAENFGRGARNGLECLLGVKPVGNGRARGKGKVAHGAEHTSVKSKCKLNSCLLKHGRLLKGKVYIGILAGGQAVEVGQHYGNIVPCP